jgi:HK97 family phage major capsid protein
MNPLEKRIKEIRDRLSAIDAECESRSGTELQALNDEQTTLITELSDLQAKLEQRNKILGTNIVPLAKPAVIQPQQPEQRRDVDQEMEYRMAFMHYCLTGERPAPKEGQVERRIDATTTTGDIGMVIPMTIMNQVVEKLTEYGMIWSRVSKTNIRGGIKIPTANAKPSATWKAEGQLSDKQKKEIKTYIEFSYNKLQCRVAVTLEADTVSLAIFEQTIVRQVNEAMVTALETAILNGDGTGEPLGIIKDTAVPATQVVEMTAKDMADLQKWIVAMSKMPRSYRAGASLILNDADWQKYLVGMLDANGNPVARSTIGLNGLEIERFNGHEVIPVEQYITAFDDANAGDIFGVYCRLGDYMFNSNLQMTNKRYFDEDTDEWIWKSTLIGDGKLSDKNGVVLLKKKV